METDLISAFADAVAARVVARLNITAPPPAPTQGEWQTTEQAATYVRLAPATLETYRCRGGGPAYFRSGRRIRYRKNDLDAWLTQRDGKEAERDQAIREAHDAGVTHSELARTLGLTRERVRQIAAKGSR